MNNLRDILSTSTVIRTAFDTSKALGQKVYLVGGAVRDILIYACLGNDFDFVVEGKGIPFAQTFAGKSHGSFFVLDDSRDTSRVIGKNRFQADFSGMHGGIEEDLRSRDFTINSMAVPLDSIFESGGMGKGVVLLDPLGGVKDINDKLLRASSQSIIQQDPLRIMRAFRFSSYLGFAIDEELSILIKKAWGDLSTVSEERVRAELFMVLDRPAAYKALRAMDGAGVLKGLFPDLDKWKGFFQGGWHIHDLFDHSMKTVDAVEDVLSRLNIYFPRFKKEIESLMCEEIEACVTRRGLVKFASLLHDSGKFYTRTMEDGRGRFLGHEAKGEEINCGIARRLKLSRRTEMMFRGLTANHMRILGLSRLKKITTRARYRFFRDAEGYAVELLILSLADSMATPVDEKRLEDLKGLIRDLASYYFEEFTKGPQISLITGEDIMRIFGIPQGKEIGRMLEALREAEALGVVSDRKEGIDYLKKLVL